MKVKRFWLYSTEKDRLERFFNMYEDLINKTLPKGYSARLFIHKYELKDYYGLKRYLYYTRFSLFEDDYEKIVNDLHIRRKRYILSENESRRIKQNTIGGLSV